MTAYYNENNPFAAAWLKELIKAGHIAHGIVDDRSITDVKAKDLEGFIQCHFFAGIGVWSYALRQSGWPDDRPVWTGSCPCQPFSTAGKHGGIKDERHLWPEFYRLIAGAKRAAVPIFGEQVAGKAGEAWFDIVSDDLEAQGYAVGAVSAPCCCFGAPHKRQRLYWVADPAGGAVQQSESRAGGWRSPAGGGQAGTLGDTNREGRGQAGCTPKDHRKERASGQGGGPCHAGEDGFGKWVDGFANASGQNDHFWQNADWLYCRDERWRPVEPGTVPLAHGAPARVGRLRGYGNAINAEHAKAFIEAYMEV